MRIVNWVGGDYIESVCYSFVNLYSYILLRKRKDLASIQYMSDGFLICLLAKFFGHNISRFSFDMTSLAPIVFDKYKDRKFAIIGSTENNLKKFEIFLEKRYKLDVSFSSSGYFSKEQLDDVINSVIESGSEIAVIGLGTPLQEEFMIRLSTAGFTGIAFTCGGFITQTAGSGGIYYPNWINRLNLRFVYRMIKEPHTIKRYFFLYPKGAFLFIYDCIFKKNVFR